MFHAYAAHEQGGVLEPFTYVPSPLGHNEVEINVHHCGICHSDLSMLHNAWGMTHYPFVPGHEVVGTVGAVGSEVKHLHVGEWVGLGWHSAYCMHCPCCLGGDHNLCQDAEGTIVGRHGGFGDHVRADAQSVIPLPSGLDVYSAGPLLCGGITVFNPLVQFNVSPTDRVGVIGIGGLGHLAVQFLNAWGCEVTAFTSSPKKRKEALKFGAHETLDSTDGKALARAAGRFDLLISTVNVDLDWNAYIGTLKPKGRLHVVGATLEPMQIAAFPLIAGQREISGSPVGSPGTLRKMLEFAARHKIKPIVEGFRMDQVNQALDHLRSGKAHYRIILNQ